MDPPPPRPMAYACLQCLGGALLAERHRLSVAGRSTARMDRYPPGTCHSSTGEPDHTAPGKFCLKAGQDGVLVITEATARSFAAAQPRRQRGHFLPIIYTQSQGLDAQSARFLMRSWAMRASGDVEVRLHTTLTSEPPKRLQVRLVRWLSAMARVRSATSSCVPVAEPSRDDPTSHCERC